jgi:hypothetical protein
MKEIEAFEDVDVVIEREKDVASDFCNLVRWTFNISAGH